MQSSTRAGRTANRLAAAAAMGLALSVGNSLAPSGLSLTPTVSKRRQKLLEEESNARRRAGLLDAQQNQRYHDLRDVRAARWAKKCFSATLKAGFNCYKTPPGHIDHAVAVRTYNALMSAHAKKTFKEAA